MRQITLSLLWALLIPKSLLACPIQISAEKLPKTFLNKSIKQLHAFRYKDNAWHKIPLQAHLRDEAKRFMFHVENPQLTLFDNLLIPNHHIYGQTTYKLPPCKGSGVQIHTATHGTTYIMACSTNLGTVESAGLHYDNNQSTIHSDTYTYAFDPFNQMLFKSISLHNEPLVGEADFVIRADFKKFFTFFFKRKHIRSEINEQKIWDAGIATQINFFLKVLFFKIELALTSDLFFYSDSGHIPMVLMLPAHAKDYVHPGSGLLYSWENLHPDLKWEHDFPKMTDDFLENTNDIQHIKQHKCRHNMCTFSLTGRTDKHRFKMHFKLPQNLIEAGFYPIFVENINDWDDMFPTYDSSKRSGLYFEAAGLHEGRHTWDFWIQLENHSNMCPEPINSMIKVAT